MHKRKVMKERTGLNILWVVLVVWTGIGWLFWSTSEYRGSRLLKVGDCVISDYEQESYDNQESWEEVNEPTIYWIVRKGHSAYKAKYKLSWAGRSSDHIKTIDYAWSASNYTKVKCPQEY